jgi:ribosome-associated toxin RatA of RatAB toxin-antitoxin module
MSDTTSSTIIIEAPASEVMAIVADLEKYPEWAGAIKSVQVDDRDDQGRPSTVQLAFDAGAMKDRLTVEYDWSEAPATVRWSLVEANYLKAMDGAYSVKDLGGDECEVTYSLAVELSMPMMAMLKQKAEKAIVDVALKDLKNRAEA